MTSVGLVDLPFVPRIGFLLGGVSRVGSTALAG